MSSGDNEVEDLGLRVITIVIRDGNEPPTVDLGDCSPILAYGVLHAVMDSVDILIPHCNIDANGKPMLSILDSDDDM